MKEIAVHDIRDGQVLAVDVMDEGGQVLLAQGTPLSRSHVALLERRGALTVSIVDEDETQEADGAAPSRDELTHALERLEHMFEGMDDDIIMRAIHAAARGMLTSALPGERPPSSGGAPQNRPGGAAGGQRA